MQKLIAVLALVASVFMVQAVPAMAGVPLSLQPPGGTQAFVTHVPHVPMYRGSREVALTFDDGPTKYTRELLATLRAEDVHATFCVIGWRVATKLGQRLVREEHAEGDELCNHSWHHPVLTRRNVASQIDRTDAAIRRATGTMPPILRAPYGDLRYVGHCYRGRRFVMWDDDTLDWRYRSVAHVTRAAERARSGSIILMHDRLKTTVEAVPAIIAFFKARGYRFVTVSQLGVRSCEPHTARSR